MTEKGKRIDKLMTYFELNKNSFSKEIGLTNNVTIGRILNEDRDPSPKTIKMILDRFPQVNPNWLKFGEVPMIVENASINLPQPRKKIPVYDSQTIGGVNGAVANVDGSANVSEEIDAGDWFPEATAARHNRHCRQCSRGRTSPNGSHRQLRT